MTIIQQTAVATSEPAARARLQTRTHDGRTAFFFLLPSLLGVLLFLVLPIIASLVLSFTNWKLLAKPAFVGVANVRFAPISLIWSAVDRVAPS